MRNVRLPLAVLIALQVIAVLFYPLSFFQRAPQAAVLPPTLLLLLILAIVGFNTGTLSQDGTRSLLIFVQGLNAVVRLIMLLPNLKLPTGEWAAGLLIVQFITMGLSWYSLVAIEHRSLNALRLTKAPEARRLTKHPTTLE